MKYSDNTLALLWLNSFDNLSPHKRTKLLECVNEPYELYYNLDKYKDCIVNICDITTFERFQNASDKSYLNMLISEIERYNVVPLAITNDRYPNLLKEIDTPPILLYCKGNIEILNNRLISVVGTRLPTRYGKDTTEKFTRELIDYGFNIVSGLARGIDTIAHTTALSCNSPQIAVLGCGLDTVYPSENRNLLNNIINDNGLIISEYRIGEKPLSYHFPERNRIISGLSEGVLVTEAGEKSGSLITINCAVEQNRRIYIVPGNIYSKQSKGANMKLKQLQGALVTEIDDILKDYNIEKTECIKEDPVQLNMTENIIMQALSKEELHIEELIKLTELDINIINPILTKMEIMGLIKKLYGNYYGV